MTPIRIAAAMQPRFWAVLGLMLCLTTVVQPALASGPGTGGRTIELEDQPAGPYLVSVFSSPAPPVTDKLYLEIRVKDAASLRVIAGGIVMVRAEPVGFEADSVESEATHAIAPLIIDFAAHLPVSRPGTWQITIDIDGPGGPASLSFPLQINRTSQSSPLLWPVAFLAGVVLVWAMVASRRRRTGGPQTATGE